MTLDESALLNQDLELLEKSMHMLMHSYEKCKQIEKKDHYTIDELESFEALTSRFARTSDILIQKVFIMIDQIELEFDGSIIDRINRAEKRELIRSAETFKSIRRLRNRIAHEYVPEEIENLFNIVMEMTPEVIYSASQIQKRYAGENTQPPQSLI